MVLNSIEFSLVVDAFLDVVAVFLDVGLHSLERLSRLNVRMKALNIKEPLVLAGELLSIVQVAMDVGLAIFMEFSGHNDLIEAISLPLESLQDLLLSQGTLRIGEEPALSTNLKLR
jgi:hypothetical protein